MSTLSFPIEDLKLQQIYAGTEYRQYTNQPFASPKTEAIYGPMLFPMLPENRTYTFGSFVISVDGRISYPSSPDGNLVANTNKLDPNGGLCDYWILNLLRANSDAVVMGSLTIKREPELTGRIYDEDLLGERVKAGFSSVPLLVIVSSAGENIPLDHLLYREPDIPTLTAVSPAGAAALQMKRPGQFTIINNVTSEADLKHVPPNLCSRCENWLIGIGQGEKLDPSLVLKVLKKGGAQRSLIETPTFLASLMKEQMLDELFLNTSGIMIGGKSLTIGENFPAFTPRHHPHTKILTMHMHSDSFLYTRYKINYAFMEKRNV